MTSKSLGSPSRSVHHNNLMNKAGSIKQLKACMGIPVSAQPQTQQQKQALLQQALFSMKDKSIPNVEQSIRKQEPTTAVRQGPPPGFDVPISSPFRSTPAPPPGLDAPISSSFKSPPAPPPGFDVPASTSSRTPLASVLSKNLEESPLDRLISRHFDGDDSEGNKMKSNNVQKPEATTTASSAVSLKEMLGVKKSNSPTSVSNSAAPAPVKEIGAQLKHMLIKGETQQDQSQQQQQPAVSAKARSSSLGDKKPDSNLKDGSRGDKERSSSLGETKKEKSNNKKGKDGAKVTSKDGPADSQSPKFATSKFMASPDPQLMPMPDFDESFLKDNDD